LEKENLWKKRGLEAFKKKKGPTPSRLKKGEMFENETENKTDGKKPRRGVRQGEGYWGADLRPAPMRGEGV